MKVAIIGGGLLGLSVAYEMTRQPKEIEVQLFERATQLGGVAGSMPFGGSEVDRFYHCILSSDSDLLELIGELGLSEQVRFKETRMGFYHDAKLYPMTSPLELLKFPPLRLIDRLRLAYTIVHSRLFIKNWAPLERKSVEKWLIELGGRRTYNLIWKPLLNAKFDGGFANIPATYIWSRIVRVSSASDKKAGKELSGHLIGGYQVLAERIAAAIEAGGGKVNLGANIKEIVIANNKAVGLKLESGFEAFDAIIVTTPSHIFSRLIPQASEQYRQSLENIPYLGIVCIVLALDRTLTPYYTLNITDTSIPFTGVIETTNLISPEFVNGNHLVYLPKYILPDNPLARMPDGEVKELFLAELKKMFPDFEESWLIDARVMRERFVEPLHNIQATWHTPEVTTPIENLSLANTAQIWPELTNGQSVTTYGRKIARKLLLSFNQKTDILQI
jgi:protoporphyrinogen oxidase